MTGSALLLSGGLDSATLAGLLRPERAIVVDYGQVCAAAEIRAAQAVTAHFAIPLDVIRVDCRAIGSGDLSGQPRLALAPSREWWPYRNQLLATLAGPVAIQHGIKELLFGTVSTDGFHADGTEQFFAQLDALMRLQEGAVRVAAPAIYWTSARLIREAKMEMDLLGWTHLCHVGELACGLCRGCTKRAAVLSEVGFSP